MIFTQKNPQYLTREEQSAISHTTSPIVTGSSVIALTFKDGIIMGTDTLCSYGSMLDFKNVQRIERISQSTMMASSGEFSDFQEVIRLLGEKSKEAHLYDDGVHLTPRDYANYLARVSYQKRNKMNPLYLLNVVAGFHNGESYLGKVDLYGTYLEQKFVTTGFADYLCKSVITNYWRENSTEAEARQVLIECFKILFYRDSRAHDRIQISVVDRNGVRIEDPFQLDTKWDYKGFTGKANEKLHNQ